jgi:hypothetical protein
MVRQKIILIRGMKWKLILLSYQEFHEKYGEGIAAITEKPERTIFFNQFDVDIKTVRHELFHAYCNELFLNSSEISLDDFEEILAEFFEDFLPEFGRKSNQIHKWLRITK